MTWVYRLVLVLAVIGGTLGTSLKADAAFKIQLYSTTAPGPIIIEDNVGGDSNGTAGIINFSVSVGEFDLTVTTARSKPFAGSAATPILRTTVSFDKASGSLADDLYVLVTDTDFGPPPNVDFKNSAGGAFEGSISSVTLQGYANDSNNEFDTSGNTHTALVFATSPYSGYGMISPGGLQTPYSLTQAIHVVAGEGEGGGSIDSILTPAPAPAGLVLALTGLPAFGIVALIRRRKAASAQ